MQRANPTKRYWTGCTSTRLVISHSEGHDERDEDDEHGVLDGAIGLHVDVDGLDQADAERRRLGLLLQLLGDGRFASGPLARQSRARRTVLATTPANPPASRRGSSGVRPTKLG